MFSCTVFALHPYFLCVLVYCVCTSPLLLSFVLVALHFAFIFTCNKQTQTQTQTSLPPAGFFCSLILCILPVLFFPGFAFYLLLYNTHNTNIRAPRWYSNPQTLVFDRLNTEMGRIRFSDCPARSESLYRLSCAGLETNGRCDSTSLVLK